MNLNFSDTPDWKKKQKKNIFSMCEHRQHYQIFFEVISSINIFFSVKNNNIKFTVSHYVKTLNLSTLLQGRSFRFALQ